MKKLALALLLVFLGTSVYAVGDVQIGKWLKKHEEEGYKYVKEIDSGTWQMQFKMKDWKYNWNVYAQVSKNESYPDFNIIYVFTTVATLKSKPSASLMAYILKKNEDTANWGSYTIQEYKDGDWEIHYMVKLRQNSIDSEVLINAVGFVAGYANSVFSDIEDFDK